MTAESNTAADTTMGVCCYGGQRTRAACGSCAAWRPLESVTSENQVVCAVCDGEKPFDEHAAGCPLHPDVRPSKAVTIAELRELADCSPQRCHDAMLWAADEIERLRAIARPGDAAAFEEYAAARGVPFETGEGFSWEATRRGELNYIKEVLLNIRKQNGEFARESAHDTLAWLENRLSVKANEPPPKKPLEPWERHILGALVSELPESARVPAKADVPKCKDPCFLCARSRMAHVDNALGHPWRDGPVVPRKPVPTRAHESWCTSINNECDCGAVSENDI